MYVISTEAMVAPGRAADFEARNERWNELLRAQPGYAGGVLLNSLGYPGKYVRSGVWENRAAGRAFAMSPAFLQFQQQNPIEGIATPTRPAEAWEIIDQIRGPGQPGHAVLAQFTIERGKEQTFVESRRALLQLRRGFGRGVVTSALTRFLGGGGRYSVYHSALTADDLQAFIDSAEFQEWARTHGWDTYSSAPMVGEAFDVVQVMAPVTA